METFKLLFFNEIIRKDNSVNIGGFNDSDTFFTGYRT